LFAVVHNRSFPNRDPKQFSGTGLLLWAVAFSGSVQDRQISIKNADFQNKATKESPHLTIII
jgi:hypothetical protein